MNLWVRTSAIWGDYLYWDAENCDRCSRLKRGCDLRQALLMAGIFFDDTVPPEIAKRLGVTEGRDWFSRECPELEGFSDGESEP